MLTSNLPSSSVSSSCPAEKFSENPQLTDFQDAGYMSEKVTISMTFTIGDLHRMFWMTNTQCANVVHFIASALAPDYLTYERQTPEQNAPSPNLDIEITKSISNSLMAAEAERERFREYGRLGGRPRNGDKKRGKRTARKTPKPSFETAQTSLSPTPSDSAEKEAQKPRVFPVVTSCESKANDTFLTTSKNPPFFNDANNCESKTNEQSLTYACAHTRIYKSGDSLDIRRGVSLVESLESRDTIESRDNNPTYSISQEKSDSEKGVLESTPETVLDGSDTTHPVTAKTGRQVYVKTKVNYPEVTWPTKTNASPEEMLMAIQPPTDRRWHTITVSYKRGGGCRDVWDTWSRQDKEHYDKDRNDWFWDSIETGPEAALGDKITIGALRGAYWHGISTVRPFLGATGVFYSRSTKQKDGDIANGTRHRGENTMVAPLSGHAVCGDGAIGEGAPVCTLVKEELTKMMMDFMTNRGFTKEFIASRGYEGTWHKVTGRPAVKITQPGHPGCFVYRFMDSEPDSDDGRPKYSESRGDAFNYNDLVLKDLSVQNVFLTEGELDADSICQTGYAAMAVHVPQKFEKALGENDLTGKHFVIVADRDETGEAKGNELAKLLESRGLSYSIHTMPEGFKDPNAYLRQFGTIALRDRMMEFLWEDGRLKIDEIKTTRQVVNNSANGEMPKIAMA